MEVKDIIDLKTVKTNMNVNTKEEALKELANLLLENGNISDEKGFIKGIILFAVGNDHKETTSHLKLLSLFARKLGNDEVVREFLQSKSPEDVVKVFS